MILSIILKKVDADGLGGDVLVEQGMKQSAVNSQIFSIQLPSSFIGGDTATNIVERLTDLGIKPMRVHEETGGLAQLTPFSASVQKVLDLL